MTDSPQNTSFLTQKCAKSDIQLEKQSKHDNNHYNMLADVKKT